MRATDRQIGSCYHPPRMFRMTRLSLTPELELLEDQRTCRGINLFNLLKSLDTQQGRKEKKGRTGTMSEDEPRLKVGIRGCGARAAPYAPGWAMPPSYRRWPRSPRQAALYMACTGLDKRPIPSTSTATSSPACRKTGGFCAKPTPDGVPVLIRSPG